MTDPDAPTDLAERTLARLKTLGITQAEAARRGRFNPVFISDMVRGRKRELRHDNWQRLARALGTSVGYLRFGEPPSEEEQIALLREGWLPPHAADPALLEAFQQLEIAERDLADFSLPEDRDASAPAFETEPAPSGIPLFRASRRADGAAVVTQPATDFLPARLVGLYAVAVPDTAMAPKYEPGECVYARELSVTNPKDFVVVRLRGKAGGKPAIVALIRQLIRRTKEEVVVRQLLPSIETRYPRSSVLAIDRIVLAGEALGDRDL